MDTLADAQQAMVLSELHPRDLGAITAVSRSLQRVQLEAIDMRAQNVTQQIQNTLQTIQKPEQVSPAQWLLFKVLHMCRQVKSGGWAERASPWEPGLGRSHSSNALPEGAVGRARSLSKLSLA